MAGMKLSEVRRLALALPEATEEDHHGRPSFRIRGKIFATLPDGDHVNVMLDAEETEMAVSTAPDAFEELHWGKRLAGVRVELAKASSELVADLLARAWRRIAPRALVERFDALDR